MADVSVSDRVDNSHNSENERARLELKKLKLELDDARFRASTLADREELDREKARLEVRGLEQDLLEKSSLSQHRAAMNRREIRKADLEISEKEAATKHALPPAVWDVLKYLVAVIPVMVTLVGLYLTYEKDTSAFRHQAEVEQKFRIDKTVLDLLKSLGDTNQTDAVNAALLLPTYGSTAIRIAIPHLRLKHPPWYYSYLIRALIDAISTETDPAKQRELAKEILQRVLDQTDTILREVIDQPSDLTLQSQLMTHLRAITQFHKQCSPVCPVLYAALNSESNRLRYLMERLTTDAARTDFSDQSRKELDQMLGGLKQVISSPGK
jgi:hypothetical protein